MHKNVLFQNDKNNKELENKLISITKYKLILGPNWKTNKRTMETILAQQMTLTKMLFNVIKIDKPK